MSRSRRALGGPGTSAYSTGVADARGATLGAPGGGPPLGREEIWVDLDWRSVAVALGAFAALVVLTGLVREATDTITVVVVGSLLALGLNPLVTGAQRRLGNRRSAGVAVVLVGFLLSLVAILVLLGPPAVREVQRLRGDIPEVVRQLYDVPVVGGQLREADAATEVEGWLDTLQERLRGDATPVARAGRVFFDGVLTAFLTVLVAVSLLLDGARLVRHAGRLVPRRHRPRAERAAAVAYRIVGRYMAGSVLVAAIAGIAVLVAGLVLGVPLAPLLAVWVAAFDLVPQIGGAVGGIPFVMLAATEGAGTGIIAAVFFVLYLQFENHVLQPLVVGQAVQLSPPATMTAALVGVSAAGVVGAIVAVPLVGAAKAVFLELRPPAPEKLILPNKRE